MRINLKYLVDQNDVARWQEWAEIWSRTSQAKFLESR